MASASPPANDNFANPVVLTGSTLSVPSTTTDATLEPGEPDHAAEAGSGSVWFEWTSPVTGMIRTLVCVNSEGISSIAFYTGASVDMLMETASGYCTLNVLVTAGTTYRIAVNSEPGLNGDFPFSLQHYPPPANDAFADAEPLAGNSGSVEGTALGSSYEPGEPEPREGEGGHSVWYSWTPSISGRAELLVCTLGTPDSVSVFTGSSLATLVDVDRGYCSSSFQATAGTQYFISVDHNLRSAEPFELSYGIDLKAAFGRLTVNGPGRLVAGRSYKYKVRISNTGATRATETRLAVSGRGIRSTKPLGNIGVGDVRIVELRIRPRRVGRQVITFRVSADNAASRSVKKTVVVRR
jgi:hypothetical protein